MAPLVQVQQQRYNPNTLDPLSRAVESVSNRYDRYLTDKTAETNRVAEVAKQDARYKVEQDWRNKVRARTIKDQEEADATKAAIAGVGRSFTTTANERIQPVEDYISKFAGSSGTTKEQELQAQASRDEIGAVAGTAEEEARHAKFVEATNKAYDTVGLKTQESAYDEMFNAYRRAGATPSEADILAEQRTKSLPSEAGMAAARQTAYDNKVKTSIADNKLAMAKYKSDNTLYGKLGGGGTRGSYGADAAAAVKSIGLTGGKAIDAIADIRRISKKTGIPIHLINNVVPLAYDEGTILRNEVDPEDLEELVHLEYGKQIKTTKGEKRWVYDETKANNFPGDGKPVGARPVLSLRPAPSLSTDTRETAKQVYDRWLKSIGESPASTTETKGGATTAVPKYKSSKFNGSDTLIGEAMSTRAGDNNLVTSALGNPTQFYAEYDGLDASEKTRVDRIMQTPASQEVIDRYATKKQQVKEAPSNFEAVQDASTMPESAALRNAVSEKVLLAEQAALDSAGPKSGIRMIGEGIADLAVGVYDATTGPWRQFFSENNDDTRVVRVAAALVNNAAHGALEVAGSPYTVTKMFTDWLVLGEQKGSPIAESAQVARSTAAATLNDIGITNPSTQQLAIIGSELLIPGSALAKAIIKGPKAVKSVTSQLIAKYGDNPQELIKSGKFLPSPGARPIIMKPSGQEAAGRIIEQPRGLY